MSQKYKNATHSRVKHNPVKECPGKIKHAMSDFWPI